MATRGKLYTPSDADRQFVTRCIIAGDMSMENIAECLGITDDTLRKHFRYEIVTSRAVIKGKAIGVINDALTDGSVDAAKFVLSRIAGWTEKQDHTIGGELDHKHVHRIERVIIKANGANDPDSNG